jgi:succinylglutamic semialdehyde dehydrogenase
MGFALEPHSLWINHENHRGSAERFQSRNPANGEVVFDGTAADASQVSLAVAAAVAAQPTWEQTELEERAAILRRFAQQVAAGEDELAQLITRETGKLPSDAAGEVKAVIAKVEITIEAHQLRRIEHDLDVPQGTAQTRYRAIGPVVVLGPFNFPAHLPGGHIVPAILAGNCVVFKPSELTPAVGRWIVDCWTEAGLPSGVINLIQGDRRVAGWLIDDPRIAGVFFTGGHAAGQSIHRQLAGRPEVLLALEMGGNNPLVVLAEENRSADDPATASELIFQSAFASSGQRCTCARRLIVVDNDYGRSVVDALSKRIERTTYGIASDKPSPEIGPLISPTAVANLLRVQAAWIRAGGQPLSLLEPIEFPTGSWGPTLVRCGAVDVTHCGTLSDEEWFGPLLQIHYVPDFDQAIGLANATRFGLSAGLVGGSRTMFERFRREVRAGVINWNRPLTGASSSLPFGGVGHSGNHRPAGSFAVDFCSDPVASIAAPTITPEN